MVFYSLLIITYFRHEAKNYELVEKLLTLQQYMNFCKQLILCSSLQLNCTQLEKWTQCQTMTQIKSPSLIFADLSLTQFQGQKY